MTEVCTITYDQKQLSLVDKISTSNRKLRLCDQTATMGYGPRIPNFCTCAVNVKIQQNTGNVPLPQFQGMQRKSTSQRITVLAEMT